MSSIDDAITAFNFYHAGLAQLEERLTCNQDAAGSIPVTGSTFFTDVQLFTAFVNRE